MTYTGTPKWLDKYSTWGCWIESDDFVVNEQVQVNVRRKRGKDIMNTYRVLSVRDGIALGVPV